MTFLKIFLYFLEVVHLVFINFIYFFFQKKIITKVMKNKLLKYCFYSSNLYFCNIMNGMNNIKSIFSNGIKSTDIEKIKK